MSAHKALSGKTLVFENIDFGDKGVGVIAGDFTAPITLEFRNCKMGRAVSSGANVPGYYYNCTFTGQAGKKYDYFYNCFLGNHSPADGTQPICNVEFHDCYFAYLKNEKSLSGSHIDGAQTIGETNTPISGIVFDNCRFTLPQLGYGGENTSYINSAFFLCPEKSDLEDVIIKDCIIDIAGSYNPIRLGEVTGTTTNDGCTFENVHASNKYSDLFYEGSDKLAKNVTNCGLMSELYVSSIYAKNDDINIVVTNATDEQRMLTIKTNKGEKQVSVAASPTNDELIHNSEYVNMTVDDYESIMVNVIETIELSDVEYVVCYDGDKQIRFVDFTNDKKHTK